MVLKNLKSRWLESQDACAAFIKIKKALKNGEVLKKEYSPFGVIGNDYSDFRGLDLSNQQIKKIRIERADFSYSNFHSSWIEKSIFRDVRFDNVDFTEISDRGNSFKGVFFLNCKFNKAGIGYEGTQYLDCIFDNSNFTKSVFIRSEFYNSQIISCKLKGVDFNASYFENCAFIGKLEDVWFRGGYAFPSDIKEFGKAKKNQMSNVSFEEAILEGVNFSNECVLSTIKIPKSGNYKVFNNWAGRLEHLKTIIADWPAPQRKEVEIFVNSYFVHAKTQDWFLINIEEIQRDFGVDIAANIIIAVQHSL